MGTRRLLEAAPEAVRRGPAPEGGVAVSVIVATRDRCEELETALASVASQKLPDGSFETVVVDDGSVDGTWEWLERWARDPGHVAARLPASFGAGAARNAGVRLARGSHLVFLDSDCRAEPGWLAALVAPFADPAVGAVGGAEIDDPTEPATARAAQFALTSPLTTGRVRGGSGLRAARYRPRSFSMAVRREAFERAGGFPSHTYGEDVELSGKVAAQGLRGAYAPEARVRHRRRRTLRGLFAQAFAIGRARVGLIRADRQHAEPIYFGPAAALVAATALALAGVLLPAARGVVLAAFAAAAAYLLVVATVAARRTRRVDVALLTPLVVVVQQTAYALGFLAGWIRPGRPEAGS